MSKQLTFDMDGQLSLNIVTALGPGDPDDGDAGRQQRGMAIAALSQIEENRLGYKIASQSGNGSYVVTPGDDPFCTCPDFEKRGERCKHVYAVEFIIQREERPDGTTVETKAVRFVPMGQDWPAYNAAQINEGDHFAVLLRELCDTIPQPPHGRGRPRLPLSDMVFAVGQKVYSTMSGRRAMSDIRSAQADGLIDRMPSFTSVARYLENPELAPILKSLIEQSALPLKSVEQDFAVDSSGFSTSVFDRRFSHKWGKQIKEARWIKAHIICGVQTNIITSAEVNDTMGHDSPQFPALVTATADNFTINEVSADKAYLSKRNLRVVEQAGGTAYIPFKSNSKAITHHKRDGLWERTFHYFNLHRGEFLEHYHKRPNVETAFHMIKAKFGGAVRTKTPVAQVNEVLVKILCHNVTCLIRAMYELGVEPTFGTESSVVPKVALN